MFPLVLRSFGVIATIDRAELGAVLHQGGRQPGPDDAAELRLLHRLDPVGRSGLGIATYVLLGDQWYWFFGCGIVGILTGICFVYITQYYTAGSWRPVQGDRRRVAHRPGDEHHHRYGRRLRDDGGDGADHRHRAGRLVPAGLATRDPGRGVRDQTGIFGTAVATMGMLMSAAYILAMDTFGPITDNAGGITEFSGAPESARQITDSLDAVGNTTKALTKGYAVASAGLAAFLLFSALPGQGEGAAGDTADGSRCRSTSRTSTCSWAALLGVMLVFLFSSLAIRAVGKAAGEIIEEVRRQFREDPGIMAGTSRPDYARAVDITAKASLQGDDRAGAAGGRHAGGRWPAVPLRGI